MFKAARKVTAEARKIAAEIARVIFGPTWVEEAYVEGLVAAGRREETLRLQLLDAERQGNMLLLDRERLEKDLSRAETDLHTCWGVAVGSPEAGAKSENPKVQQVVKMRRTLDHLVGWLRERDDPEGTQFGPGIAGAVLKAEKDAREGVPGPEVVTRDSMSRVIGSLDHGVWKQ